ncbi:hypothetical protein GALMADRAFT_598580 [Galerina marginata CBS 339.88]|uniref:Ubiquitin-like domain-containing protein n=1 Tax=Galerina marginata (strain CBS 339.88) TaxID=685588 RepID=A0A067T4U7_GALM3|nr:hypothetical protein GALMADRAFT_598580 [Galerina marginata CBS 339.88]
MPGVVFAFTVGSLGDILATAGLAGQIAKTLYDSASVNAECRALVLELKSLQKTLILTHHALHQYLASPIGEALAGFIEPEVAQAHLLLQGYLDKVNACRKALLSTTIASLWRKVAWTASSETLALNEKLRHHEGKLTMLLVALNSVGLLDLGTEIRQIGAHVREVHAYLLENARPLRRIQDNTVRVLDPLGETIPIPDLFLSTWESFDHIIKGYFRNRIGQRYVEQGLYEVLHSDDSQNITPSQFSNTVKAGDELEMSIVLRQKIGNGEENSRRCPRCYHDNADVSDELRRWVQW